MVWYLLDTSIVIGLFILMNFTHILLRILIHRLSFKWRDDISPLCCHFQLDEIFTCSVFQSQPSHCWYLPASDCRIAWSQLQISIAPFWPGTHLLVTAKKARSDKETPQGSMNGNFCLTDTLHSHNILDKKAFPEYFLYKADNHNWLSAARNLSICW